MGTDDDGGEEDGGPVAEPLPATLATMTSAYRALGTVEGRSCLGYSSSNAGLDADMVHVLWPPTEHESKRKVPLHPASSPILFPLSPAPCRLMATEHCWH